MTNVSKYLDTKTQSQQCIFSDSP